MVLKLMFHISDIHNFKIINNVFFFVFKGGLIFLPKGGYIYIFMNGGIDILI